MKSQLYKENPAQAAIEDWDDYFLAIAKMVSLKSKDRSRVGAVIVSPDRMIVSTGYNGPPRGVVDSETLFRENESGDDIQEKLRWICHAEQNAILNAVRLGVSVKDCTIYVNKFPCLACLISIVQSGIQCVYTHDIDFWKNDPFDNRTPQSGKTPHWRKRALINQAKLLRIRAPFHESYQYECGREYLSWQRIYKEFLKDTGEADKDSENKRKWKERNQKGSEGGQSSEETAEQILDSSAA